jgi:RNA polymerase sigma-70 factor (ECF subfamily)
MRSGIYFMREGLIQQILADDRDAYAELVDEHQSMLLAYAAYRVPDRDLAEEVTQQTFIRAYEQLADFRTDQDFGVWLRVICRYMILAELKKQTRCRANREKYAEALRSELMVQAMNTLDELPDGDIYAQLRACIEQLQPRAAEVINLKYTQDQSCREIAETTARSLTWVTSTLSRVRKALRQCLEQYRMMEA